MERLCIGPLVMNTFLPYPDFHKSAQVLDDVRLRNQTNRECTTLWKGGWPNHPAARMWVDYRAEFVSYWFFMISETDRRGFGSVDCPTVSVGMDWPHPWWLGVPEFHAQHRANLLRKDPDHYGQFGWTEEPTEGYWWPLTQYDKRYKGEDGWFYLVVNGKRMKEEKFV